MPLPRRNSAPAQPAEKEKKRPVMSIKASSDRTTSLEIAVWLNSNEGENGQKFDSYSLSINRSYRKEDGQWVQNTNFRPHDLPVLLFLVNKAYDYILSEKAESTSN